MGTADRILAKMRQNPRDWRIEDLLTVAASEGLNIRRPGGSHVVFTYPDLDAQVAVPAHRPIRPVYIKLFLDLVDRVRARQ